jgi:uncharacterized protein YjbI with pentapeptide repeats
MKKAGWGPLLAVFALLVISCGGGRDSTLPDGGVLPTFAVAKLTTAQDVLELPLLQSGAALYADVSIKLADDGTFNISSWRTAIASAAPVDGTLNPPIPLQDLTTSTQAVQLSVRHLHLDNGIYQAVQIELKQGHWRYLTNLVATQTVSALDLRANASLIATDDHLVVMQSAPGKIEQFPLRLESRSYRFCMDAQEQGADTMTITDPAGATVLTLTAGGPCAAVTATQGLYQVRHTYGGTGQARTVFMRRRPQDTLLLTAQGNPVAPRSDPGDSWGILASLVNASTQAVIPGSEGFLGAADAYLLRRGNDCLARVEGIFQATSLTAVTESRIDGVVRRNRALFDGFNFFRQTSDATLGLPMDCAVEGQDVAMSSYPRAVDIIFAIEGDEPVRISDLGPSAATFSLRSRLSPNTTTAPELLAPFAPLIGAEFPVGDTSAIYGGGPLDPFLGSIADARSNQVLLRPQLPAESAVAVAQYRTVLRYRPGGLPGNLVPAQGQVALFNTADCSGAAMLVDQYNLPGLMEGGSLGSFRGSLKLGALTTADVYSGMSQSGESQHLNQSGCIPAGWGTTGWKAASLAIQLDTVEMVLSTNQCERCNLAGIDLGGKDLHNGKFAGTNLNDAVLAGTNLAGADLRQAFLQGAQLPNANLDAANMCGAKLNAAPSSAGSTNVAANLAGAFLRNADLSRSNVAGVNFNASSFFSASQSTCTPSACDSYARPTCATAAGATIDAAQFSNAYLVGADLSNAHGSGASFNNAVLTGARFNNAVLTPLNGAAANFTGSFIQGTDFTAADLNGATLTNAYAATAAGCMQFELDETHTSFPGFTEPATPDSTQCVNAAPKKACVQFTFIQPTLLPSSVVLGTPTIPVSSASPPNSSCFSQAPLCGVPLPTDRVNTCW